MKQRHFSNVNIDKFVEGMHCLETREIFQCNDVNFPYDKFINWLTTKINERFLLRSPQSRNKTKTKWYDVELRDVYRKNQLLYKTFLRKSNNKIN